LKALDLPQGAKVLIPAFTFAAVPSSVVHADCVPVLVEVGENYRVDMADFAAKLPDVQAVMISHMRGHTSDMDAIMALADAAGVPVIEDAAHSLGTVWAGRNIGTIGRVGCFSFQSYKLVNAGEGGIMITDDPEIAARAIIMSGAYEANWKKHPGLTNSCAHWQNKLPLYNLRMQNLSAAVIRPQLPLVAERVAKGRAGHDRVAGQLNLSAHLSVPEALGPEERAPDSIQFNLTGDWTDAEARDFQTAAKARGVSVQVFGLSEGNARAYWNWQFLGEVPELPQTRAMLMRACDVRLPTRLTEAELDFIAAAIVDAAAEVRG
jgi:perosamine synthetase